MLEAALPGFPVATVDRALLNADTASSGLKPVSVALNSEQTVPIDVDWNMYKKRE